MLNGLFEPGWQSESVEKRLQAIDKMDRSEAVNQPVFERLVIEDPESTVRRAALDKLAKPETVFLISQTHADATTRADAELAFSTLIGANSSLTVEQFRELISTHPGMNLSIAKHCPHPDLRSEILGRLSEAEQAELIADVEYNETRLFIANQLKSEELLHLARNLIRGKDKSAEKIIKSKLDVMHAAQRQDKENQQAAEEICEKMEYLASHEWRAEFKNKYSVWKQRWEALCFKPGDNIALRYKQASEKVATQVARELILETSNQSQTKLAESLEDYCKNLAGLSLENLLNEKQALTEKNIESLGEWTTLCELADPAVDNTEQFLLAEKAIWSLVTFCDAVSESTEADDPMQIISARESSIANLRWPSQYPVLQAKTNAIAALDELRTQNSKAEKASEDSFDKLHKRINRLLGTTKRGDLGRARRELIAVTKAAARYSGKQKNELDERLEKAGEAVKKMGDWQDFVTEPKYIELCTAMKALALSKTHPDKLSVKITELQKRWKNLGNSESADRHWPRFKKAADKAYEPCAIFFKQRHETRRQNLEKRKPLVQQMRELLENTDWDIQPDYKQVESELQRINNAWQKIKDVEAGPGQRQWNKLSKLKSAVYEKLDVVYDANIELKNQLIERVLALLEADINENSLAKLQLFQGKWKQIGVTRRKQDQAAWKKFKTASDKVYTEIQGLRKAKRADEDTQLAAYRKVSREIKQLAKTATDLAEADSNFDRLQLEYRALPALPIGLPEKLIAGLETDFRRAGDAYAKARIRIKQAGRTKTLDALSRKATLCAELEGLGKDAPTAEIQLLQNDIAAIELNNKDLIRRFRPALGRSTR